MSLLEDIASWDGRGTDQIREVYDQYHHAEKFTADLVAFLKQPSLQTGSSWMLKHQLEAGHELDKRLTKSVYRALSKLEHWQAKLHILQCMPYLPIGKAEKKVVEDFLRNCLQDENRFVRAWAYNGFHELASQHTEFSEECEALLGQALANEAASVKARIRNILKT